MFLLALLSLLGRGEILNIQGLQVEKHENSVLIDGLNVENLPPLVGVTDLGDLITRSFWAGQLKETSTIELNHQHVPSSNLFIVNFGTDSSILTQTHELQGKTADLSYDFFPADSVSILTSMTTSRNPVEHGVVGKSWEVNQSPIEAYSEPKTFSSRNTFVEVVHNQNKRTKIVTASSNPQLARAFNQEKHAFDTVIDHEFQSSNGLQFTKEDLLAAFETEEFWKQFASQIAALDASDSFMESFLMEMEYIRRLSSNMQASEELVLFNIATNTPSNSAAQEILLGTISHVQKQFKVQYPEGSSQIVFFKEPTVISNSNSETKLSVPYQAVEFSEANDGLNGPVLQDPRSYQIATWLTFFAVFIVYYFIYEFMTMDYDTDATLFTKWKRGTKIDARMGGMGDMMGDVRF